MFYFSPINLFTSEKYFSKPITFKLLVWLALIFSAMIIHSCRKDGKSNAQFAPAIIAARSWYESAYPVNNSDNGKLVTQSTGGSYDLSKLIKPDWQHAVTYNSDNKNVIEMPVDPAAKFVSTFKIGSKSLNKAYSRSYYLLMNDGKEYKAYILTIIADSAYVKNDFSKLAHNTFRKQDTDFSGLALYFTPKGDYLGGYAYRDGQLVTPAATTQQAGGQHIQSVNDNLKPSQIVITCVDWYQQGIITNPDGSTYITTPWVYIGTKCTSYDDGTSSGSDGSNPGDGTGTGGSAHSPGGGSQSPSSTPPPCPPGSSSSPPVTPPCTPSAPVANPESVNGGKLVVDYMPLPSQSTCSVNKPAVPCAANIKNDLTGCNGKVVDQLTNKDLTGEIRDILQNDFNSSDNVNLHFIESTNTGGKPAASVVTKTASSYNVEIRVNTSVLPNDASQDYKASIIIHEIIHGYLNYKTIDFNNQLKQHIDIAHNYITSIAAILEQAFGTDAENATALAFGGLKDFATAYPTDYAKLLNDNKITESIRNSDTEFQREGITGKRCN
jgi:hypothetical protein